CALPISREREPQGASRRSLGPGRRRPKPTSQPSSSGEPTYLRFSVNNRLRPLQDRIEGCRALGSHPKPNSFPTRDLEIEVVGEKDSVRSGRSNVHEVVPAFIGLRAVLRASDRSDHNTDVLDRLPRLIHDVPLDTPEPGPRY